MPSLPPAPVNEPPGSFAWQQWYSALQQLYSASGAIPWSAINTTGANLTDLPTRLHNNLQSIQGGTAGEYYHLTSDQASGQGVPTGIRTETGGTYTVGATHHNVIFNAGGTCTVTLPSASSFTGRELWFRTIAAQAVNSAASNVVPLAGGGAGTGILAATAGKWARLVSDGSNWQIMAAN